MQLSDDDLIKGCRKGHRASQKALYESYCRKMMAVCQRYARSLPEAEDILQEGFIKVFQAIDQFRGDSRLDTWMTRIMVNTALNQQRRKMYLFPMVDVTDLKLVQEEVSISGMQHDQLIEMIRTLPQGCQIVFNLFAIEGFSHKEIAENLGISEGTSKSQYARAKLLLQEKLSKENFNYGFGAAKI